MKNIFRNFLHPHTKGHKSKTWYDITLKQFNELSKLSNKAELGDLLRIVYDVEIRDIPISDISKYKLDFLKQPIPREPIKKSYTLNGTKYVANFELPSISTAQFFDFRNYTKQNDYVGVLSACLIPEGYEYNEGYDSDKVREDIESLPITAAQTISFFFWNQTAVLCKTILQSSISQLRTNETVKKNKEIQSLLDDLDSLNLTSFL